MKNVALVGAGRWGKNLARNFYQLEALHTICDTNEYLLDQYEKQFPDVKQTTNFNNILCDAEIERVVIAAPAVSHYALAKEALENGKDVYVEKPLCLEEEEAKELVGIAEKGQRILMVGHLLHYHPYIRKLKQMVEEGVFGKVLYITSNRLDLGPIRNEENSLWNFAPHDISVILSLCGNILPCEVNCTGTDNVTPGVQDNSLISLEFESGLRSHIYVSWLNPFKEQKLTVVGSEGMAVFDDTKPWDEKLAYTKVKISWSRGNIPFLEDAQHDFIVVPQEEPLRAECEHFIQCCSQRVTPWTDGREGLRVIQVLKAAQTSMDEGGIPQPINQAEVAEEELVPVPASKKL